MVLLPRLTAANADQGYAVAVDLSDPDHLFFSRNDTDHPADASLGIVESTGGIAQIDHPRLWLRAEDLPRLRSWAVDSNPLYHDGLAVLAAEAKADMDAGRVPGQDGGGTSWEEYPAEMYAELFAFMSLISNDPATRDDYGQRARSLLMHVMNEAAKGAAEAQPFRDPRFSIYNRSRWWGEAFALTVDWIYSYLSAEDKTTIRQVFLRWIDENLHATTTSYNHPEPVGLVNDPSLVSDPIAVRWSGNNYYTAHMRNIGLMAMALDEADDPGNELRSYLGNAIGAWLYVTDHLLRTDMQGGLAPEGFEYSPQAVGYIVQLLLALHTAGQDDPTTWGSQVVLSDNPFWDDVMPAFLHSLSPSTTTLAEHAWLGEVYLPAWYGDGQRYWAPDFIGVFGPLGLYDYYTDNTTRLEALRWSQKHTPPGGASLFPDRVPDPEAFCEAILYFMLFDPDAPLPTDPRPSQPLTFYAPGIGHILARTGWDIDATWFTYGLGWLTVDHQHSDGNQFEFYRQGEWLTKDRTGYGNYGDHVQTSDYHNTLALENDEPYHSDPNDYRYFHWQRGSQWTYEPLADGQIVAHSFGQDYVYALGDATGLYNSDYEGVTDITHASRSLIWVKPDHIIVYDRAASQTAGRFKRFWLQLPEDAVISSNQATMTTASGQQLFVTTLLPSNAVITSELAETGNEADEEPMEFRLRVEAPGGPQNVRFLHVLQGADAGISSDSVALIQSTSGTPFEGALVNGMVILFPVDLDTPFSSLTYSAPAGTETHLITGLTPNGGYDVVTQPLDSHVQVTINTGTTDYADSGGVLTLTIQEEDDDLVVQAFSPVDLVITDPGGREISKDDTSAIPSASYTEADLNGDGDPDDIVVIPDAPTGDYSIQVVREQDANDADTYTLDVIYGGETTRLAGNVEVQDIPGEPYIFSLGVEFSLNMKSGWNLISTPVQLLNNAIGVALQSIAGQFNSVWRWVCDPTHANGGYWRLYDPDSPVISDLATLDAGNGYWVDMKGDAVLILNGQNVSNEPIQLRQGWNHAGYNSLTAQPVENALLSIAGHFNSVWTWICDPTHANGGYWMLYDPDSPLISDLQTLEPGMGLWIDTIDDWPWDVSGGAQPAPASPSVAVFGSTGASLSHRPGIPYIIWGSVEVDGVKIASEDRHRDTTLTVVLKVDNEVRSSYQLGMGEKYGGFYRLEVPGATDHSAQVELYVQIDDTVMKAASMPPGRPGQIIRFDLSVQLPPKVSLLHQNYPNPLNPDTWIPYQLKEDAHVVIRIYTSTGQLVRTLNLGHKPAGFYTGREKAAYWDGKNEAGEHVASGVYFYSIKAGDLTAIRKMLIVK
jgi:hypothetical protein